MKVKLGALWANKTPDGTKFLSGSLNSDTKIKVWPNQYKKEDKHPDYIIWLEPAEFAKQQAQKRQETPPQPKVNEAFERIPSVMQAPLNEDDIPF